MSSSISSFDLLAPGVQAWIYRQNWTALRPIQEQSIPLVLERHDLIISSATASGKTEAAFLPVLSAISDEAGDHLKVVYVSPLKALINDQERRLVDLVESIDAIVTPWHGDIGQNRKHKLFNAPRGVLLITPESIEALFVNRGTALPAFFSEVEFVVIDELHSFIGTERGRQLQSLLHRMETCAGHRIARIALSATLGDLDLAAEFVRPGRPDDVHRIVSSTSGREVKLQIRGYDQPEEITSQSNADELTVDLQAITSSSAVADHIFASTYGGTHLVFCNSRRDVELYADHLRRICEQKIVPNQYVPHHGNLSADLRIDAEQRLQSQQPFTVVATSTLEMGIDIGQVDSVVQVGSPPSVASMRQRLGRSGREKDRPSILRIYVSRAHLLSSAGYEKRLNFELIQSIAMVRLMVAKWIEPARPSALHLSTLLQQTLSSIAQYGGIEASAAFRLLCQSGPFDVVDRATFIAFLRQLGANDLIVQTHDGTLVLGLVGERLVNRFDFYASFATPDEWRLVHSGNVLGTMPIGFPIAEGTFLIFGGRRWVVLTVDDQAKEIQLTPHKGGAPPTFSGDGPGLHERVLEEMFLVYVDSEEPAYLDKAGLQMLRDARHAFRELELSTRRVIPHRTGCIIYPWTGQVAMNALQVELTSRQINPDVDRFTLELLHTSPDAAIELASHLYELGPPDPLELARRVANLENEKHHRYLNRELLAQDYASARIDTQRAWEVWGEIAGRRHSRVGSASA